MSHVPPLASHSFARWHGNRESTSSISAIAAPNAHAALRHERLNQKSPRQLSKHAFYLLGWQVEYRAVVELSLLCAKSRVIH